MNSRKATDQQLNIVAYHDRHATNVDRHEAEQELLRRKRKRKKHYPPEYRIKTVYA